MHPNQLASQGMEEGRLLLGGDHLLENCVAWACKGCREAFRSYPYADCLRWLADRPPTAAHPPGVPANFQAYTYEL